MGGAYGTHGMSKKYRCLAVKYIKNELGDVSVNGRIMLKHLKDRGRDGSACKRLAEVRASGNPLQTR
jgi:hypothetical protein